MLSCLLYVLVSFANKKYDSFSLVFLFQECFGSSWITLLPNGF